jgi:hypothetical protein
MKVLVIMAVVTLVLVLVLPKIQWYMRMLVEEHEDMKDLAS